MRGMTIKVMVLVCLLLGCAAFQAIAADLEKGLEAYQKGDYATALEEWRPLAEQGVAVAQDALGTMYLNGHGVPQDYKEGFKWFNKAAEQGHAESQYRLGLFFVSGSHVVSQDYKQAFKWFNKAAEQGHAEAQYHIGLMYNLGNGLPKDYYQALRWFVKAAEQSHAGAQVKVCVLSEGATGVPWCLKAAEQGETGAQTYLGYIYYSGEGVPQDHIQAYAWWNVAASQGNDDAIYRRDQMQKNITPDQMAKAQDLSRQLYNKIYGGQNTEKFVAKNECERDCVKMFQEGNLKKGITLQDCINKLCN